MLIRSALMADRVQEISVKISIYTADMRRQRMRMDGEDGGVHLLEQLSR